MKQIHLYLPVFAVLSCLPAHVNAQTAVDASVGFGTGHSKATGAGIESGSSGTPFASCAISSDDSFCQSTPKLDGLFMNLGGDVMFNKLYPFIDTSSGGRVEGVVAAVDRALALAGASTKIIPGHGPLGTRADLQAYRDMLATIAGRMGEHVRAGRSLEQAIAAKPTADFDAAWGKGFLTPDRFTEMLYKNLQAER